MGPRYPIGRIGTVDKVADLIVRLCSAQASLVSGAAIPVYGAFIAQ